MTHKHEDSASKSFRSDEENSADGPILNDITKLPGPTLDFKMDAKWVLIGIVILAVVTTTIIMNNSRQNNFTSQIASTIDVDNGDENINWNRYETFEVALSDESYSITKSGIYHLTGSITNGNININAGIEGVVKLILDNVTIANTSGPAISCTAGDDLVIELVGENTLQDGTAYSSNYDEDITGAIYSKADLTFTGEGILNLTANYQDGIVSKDDLKFSGGTYRIVATDDGIRGKDSVYIVAGNFTIDSTADAIKSTNETDQGKGFVMIESGSFNLTTGAKGIKSTNTIIIYDGNYTIESTDDSIHCNNYVGIMGGTFNLASSDDGIHADSKLVIDGGNLIIAKSYEGLEAQVITINNGAIKINSSDDGINAGGGADSSAMNRMGAGTFDSDENCILSINGGNVYVNASGDGIDSNGWLYFNGGKVVVDGPTNNGNGSLDSGSGIVMNGGEVIAIGASGMASTLGSSSSINNISVYFSSTQSTNTAIEIKDSADNIILSHTSAKTFNHLSAGSSAFKLGETYTIYLNGEKYQDFTISDITTTVGNSNANRQMMPGGGTNNTNRSNQTQTQTQTPTKR